MDFFLPSYVLSIHLCVCVRACLCQPSVNGSISCCWSFRCASENQQYHCCFCSIWDVVLSMWYCCRYCYCECWRRLPRHRLCSALSMASITKNENRKNNNERKKNGKKLQKIVLRFSSSFSTTINVHDFANNNAVFFSIYCRLLPKNSFCLASARLFATEIVKRQSEKWRLCAAKTPNIYRPTNFIFVQCVSQFFFSVFIFNINLQTEKNNLPNDATVGDDKQICLEFRQMKFSRIFRRFALKMPFDFIYLLLYYHFMFMKLNQKIDERKMLL